MGRVFKVRDENTILRKNLCKDCAAPEKLTLDERIRSVGELKMASVPMHDRGHIKFLKKVERKFKKQSLGSLVDLGDRKTPVVSATTFFCPSKFQQPCHLTTQKCQETVECFGGISFLINSLSRPPSG